MMTQPDDTQILKNQDTVMKLVEKLPSGSGLAGLGRREHVKSMLAGSVGLSYFTAPASSRAEYHGCFSGGLCQHSLNVVMNLRSLANALAPGKFDNATLIFVGLFHDLGKVGDGERELYLPQNSDWHRKQGILYTINKDLQFMPTSERGLYILQKHGIQVTADEYLAIRLNDGQYVDENKPYRMKEPSLALLLHFADRWATETEKTP